MSERGGEAAVRGGVAMALVQARWNALRMIRGRTIWVAWIFALMPVALTLVLSRGGHAVSWDELFTPLLLLAGVVVPLFMASSMAEEIEDRTFTYLWSRPVPRWSVVVGKLMAAAPIATGILAVAVGLCFAFAGGGGGGGGSLGREIGAMAADVVATCGVAAGLAVLLPRQGLWATYAYLLVLDLPISGLPVSLHNLSIFYQTRVVAGSGGLDASAWSGLAWLAGIGAVWLAIGLLRLTRAEFASDTR